MADQLEQAALDRPRDLALAYSPGVGNAGTSDCLAAGR